MSRRRRAREVCLQLLYEEDVNPELADTYVARFLHERLLGDESTIEFARALFSGVRSHREAINGELGVADNWSLERMAVIDRNIIRLGVYELLYTPTPGRVVINEAVELAKRFGGENSGPFVNGVLDRIFQDQPGDDSH
ncbi:MAG: transcription antitermination factor NusB [Pirellulaceae bacterium]|jgi:N utilization substance protein B|nr:transcription antitermination factor NusB [Pirellulaceae bacterium]MDP7014934.1 transcription antitermination factor NusB [Pirellulaceae bacterium]